MLYRIEASSKDVLTAIMQKLNTTNAGFLMYWYSFDYFKKGGNGKKQESQGWFVDLGEDHYDLAEMASVLSDYIIIIGDSWKKTHDEFMAMSAEDEEYFNAIPLYITERGDVKQ